MVLRTYNKRSKGFKNLSKKLGNYVYFLPNINWGQTNNNEGLNKSNNVRLATNKISTLTTLDANELPTLEWTTDIEIAKENTPIYCRTAISESKGKGIIRAEKPEEVVRAPLYTKAIDGYEEYRIHSMNGETFYAQRKMPRTEWARKDIKTLNDYYFSKRDIQKINPQLKTLANKTIKALGLDFGAVDILKKGNDMKVLEVNTAPGMDNSTAKAYAQAFVYHYKQ